MELFNQADRFLASSPPGALWVPAVLLFVVVALVFLQQRGR